MNLISSDVSWRRRVLAAVMISGGISGLSIGLTVPLISLVLAQRGFSNLIIGLNNTFSSLPVLLAGPFYPAMIRRVGALSAMFYGALFSALVFCLFAITDSLFFWFALRLFIGFASGIYWIVGETCINAMAGEKSRGRVIGIYVTIFSLGLAAGPMVLTLVGVEGALPFVVGACIMAGAAIPLIAAHGIDPIMESEQSPKLVGSMIRLAPVAIGASFISGYLHTMVFALFPVYGLRSGFNTADAVMLISLFAAGSLVFQPVLGWLADLMDRGKLIILAAAVTTIIVPLIPVCLKYPVLIRPLVFVWGGAIEGLYALGMILIGQRFGTKDLAAASTMLVMAYTTGMVIGPVFGGVAMDILDPHGLLIALGVMATLYFLLTLCRHGKYKDIARG